MPQSSEKKLTFDTVSGGNGGNGGDGETGGDGGQGGNVTIVYNPNRANFGQQKIENDAEGKIWSIYMIEALVHDKALVERWRESMNGLLIFAGLFSATVTAFIIQSYPNLQPKPEVVVLTQILNQLAFSTLQASAIPLTNQAPFRPNASDIRVNVFWFLSLGCALGCALSATLADQWARYYLQAVERPRAAHRRAKIRSYLHEGRKVFRMSSVLEAIPMLMHLSVFLFFAGIFDIMLQINKIVAYLCLGIFGTCLFLYAVASVLPVLSLQSPYRTPLSSLLWYAWTVLHGHSDVARSMILARDNHAVLLFGANQMKEVLGWTMDCLTDEAEFEQFVEGIPGFLNTRVQEDAEKALASLGELVCDSLGHRILLLLKTCKDPKILPAHSWEHRITTCMNALWSLTVSIRPEERSAKNLDGICNEEALSLAAYFALLSYPNPQATTSCVVRTFTTITHHLLDSFDSILLQIRNGQTLQASMSEELLPDANRRARLALRAVTWLANLADRYHISENSISSARRKTEAVTSYLTHHYLSGQVTLGILQTHNVLTAQVGRHGRPVNTALEAMTLLLSLEEFIKEAQFELLIFYVGRLGPDTSSGSTETISMILPNFDFPDQDVQLRVIESLEQLILRWKNGLMELPEFLDNENIQQREAAFAVIDSLLGLTQRLNNMTAISKLQVLIEEYEHLLSPATKQRAHKVLQSLNAYVATVTQGEQ